jgi:hypothetical protein
MWLPNAVFEDVKKVARVHYVNVAMCKTWNEHRRHGELRLLTGWCWTAKDGRSFKQGFKSETIAYRDAWYELVQHTSLPNIGRPRLRLVKAA